jgi:predicted metal-dependent peptidase
VRSTLEPAESIPPSAARQASAELAARSLSAARARLVLGRDARSVFFACLALRLTPTVDWGCPTMATDGRSLAFNPEFVSGLSADELLGVVAHEVLHCAMRHFARRGSRRQSLWNEAADLAINGVLADAGFALPACRLMAGEGRHASLARGLSAEAYFALLDDSRAEDGQAAPGSRGGDTSVPTDPDPGGCGGVREPVGGSHAAAVDQVAEWAAAVAQAEAASLSRGDLPGGLARAVSEARRQPADWKAVLRDFVSAAARDDYSWTRPNRRFVARGLYLPGLRSERLGEIVVAVDCSGSVSGRELAAFAGEADAIVSAFDCSATVLYHDSAITNVQEWHPSDGPLVLQAKGGGGTDHRPVFDWLERSGKSPACVICLTDLDSRFPSRPPDVPVLWAVSGGKRPEPPFGRAIYLE